MTTEQTIALNDLPVWSPWPARLLGLEPFETAERDLAKIEAEYDRDKWRKCLDAYDSSGGRLSAADLRRLFYRADKPELRAAVHNGCLVKARGEEIMAWYDRILLEAMAEAVARSRTVVELGASFGHIMWMLKQHFGGPTYRGGDYADSSIELAGKLYRDDPDISVEKFNFYDQRYALIEEAESPVTVLTSQAVEQLPSAEGLIDSLEQYRDKIHRVFHLEPGYALYDETLLGMMRRRYIEVNDYNRDLVPELQRRANIEICRLEADVIGWNPFNSLVLIEWRFAG